MKRSSANDSYQRLEVFWALASLVLVCSKAAISGAACERNAAMCFGETGLACGRGTVTGFL